MKKLCLLISTFCLLIPTVHAQQAVLNDISIKQGDLNVQNGIITNAQAAIVTANAQITAAQAQIAIDNAAITSDTAINNAYVASTAQTASAWNFTYDAQLEAGGCRWATCFPVVFPNANLSAIASQINITCSVTEAQVNWANWPAYSAIHGSTAASWNAFYCADGPAS